MIARSVGRSVVGPVGSAVTGVGVSGGGGGPSYDTDAQAYITLVEAADTESLETGVKDAINAFVVGCKSDGIWDAIKASCILAGARTLSGALVPLVGTAPTNNNFVSGDYSRTAGLVGDGSTKYLDSNRNNNADPQNSNHNAVYATVLGSTTAQAAIAATGFGVAGTNLLALSSVELFTRNRTSIGTLSSSSVTAGLAGHSRSTSSAYAVRGGGVNYSITEASQTPENKDILIFRRASTGSPAYSLARLSFYSIGESLNLALLDSRVTTLIAGMAFAVNTGLSPVGYSIETINYVNAGYAAGGTLA